MQPYDLSNLSNVTSVQEGKIGQALEKIGATLRRLFLPTVKETLLEDLHKAKVDGRVYDARNIQSLLDLMEIPQAKFTEKDAAQLYLLNRTYVELPQRIRQLEIQLTLEKARNDSRERRN